MPRHHAAYFAAVTVALWAMVVATGQRLSYVYTFESTVTRSAVFVLLLSALFYLGYLHKGRDGLTGYQSTIGKLNGREKVTKTAGALAGLIFISAVLAWTSATFSAWGARLFATTPYAAAFEVKDIKARGGALWTARFDIDVDSPDSPLTLRLNRDLYEAGRPWKVGEHFCARGRSSLLGTTIDSVSKDRTSCKETGF